MILLATLVIGLAYMALLQYREEMAIFDRDHNQTVRTCSRYHHTPQRYQLTAKTLFNLRHQKP